MCGSGKKRLQTKAEERGQQSTALDNQRAQDMQDRLAERRGSIDIPEQRKTAQTAATGQLETGGFDPGVTEKVRTGIEESKAPATRLAADTGFSGAGREGYQEFATTGGFSPEQADRFRRAGTRAVPAIYGRAKEEGERRLALQGGYSPGFESGQARLTRQAAQESAEAGLGTEVSLAEQVRTGKLAGLGGLERTRVAAGQEQLQAGAQILSAARASGDFERDIASGRRDALDNVVRILGISIDEMANLDQAELSNRALAAGMSQQEVNALLGLASQKRSAFDYAAPFIQGGAAVGGAYLGRP